MYIIAGKEAISCQSAVKNKQGNKQKQIKAEKQAFLGSPTILMTHEIQNPAV